MISHAQRKSKIQKHEELRKRDMWLRRVKQDNKIKIYQL